MVRGEWLSEPEHRKDTTPVIEQMARTAWGAMHVHRYSTDMLTGMLGHRPDFTNTDHCKAVLRLADSLAASWGTDQQSADRALADGFAPIAAYDDSWQLVPDAVPTSPEGSASQTASRRWEIIRRMAEGWPTSMCMDGLEAAWCERSLQRFRTQHMTQEPSRYEAFQYARDLTWLARCDEAEHDPVGVGLRYGVVGLQDLPAQHPHRLLLAEQSKNRRRVTERARRARKAHTATVGVQLALAGM